MLGGGGLIGEGICNVITFQFCPTYAAWARKLSQPPFNTQNAGVYFRVYGFGCKSPAIQAKSRSVQLHLETFLRGVLEGRFRPFRRNMWKYLTS